MVDGVVSGFSVAVAAMLFIAGPGKVTAPSRLGATLRSVAADRISATAARRTARFVGATETVVAVALATAYRPRLAGALLAALGAGIVAVSAAAMARGLTVSCGCFTAVDTTSVRTLGARTLVVGVGFVVVGLLHWSVTPTGAVDLRLTTALTLALGFTLASWAGQLRPLFVRGFGRGQ